MTASTEDMKHFNAFESQELYQQSPDTGRKRDNVAANNNRASDDLSGEGENFHENERSGDFIMRTMIPSSQRATQEY